MSEWLYYWHRAVYNRTPSIIGRCLELNPAKAEALANLIGAASR